MVCRVYLANLGLPITWSQLKSQASGKWRLGTCNEFVKTSWKTSYNIWHCPNRAEGSTNAQIFDALLVLPALDMQLLNKESELEWKLRDHIFRRMRGRLAVHSKGGMSCLPGEGVEPGSSDLLHPRMVAAGWKFGGSQVRWREKLGLLRERWVLENFICIWPAPNAVALKCMWLTDWLTHLSSIATVKQYRRLGCTLKLMQRKLSKYVVFCQFPFYRLFEKDVGWVLVITLKKSFFICAFIK